MTKKGSMLFNAGNGKGKTTAALAEAAGLSPWIPGFIQFIKNMKNSGEIKHPYQTDMKAVKGIEF